MGDANDSQDDERCCRFGSELKTAERADTNGDPTGQGIAMEGPLRVLKLVLFQAVVPLNPFRASRLTNRLTGIHPLGLLPMATTRRERNDRY